MTHRYYPPIDEKSLQTVMKLSKEDNDYLSDPACPYPNSIKKLFKPLEMSDDIQDIADIMGEDHMLQEISTLYTHLKSFGQSMRESDTASEKNTYFKLSASLIEKLIDMKERISNLKKVDLFIETVLMTMEEEINIDDRSRVIKKLRDVLD